MREDVRAVVYPGGPPELDGSFLPLDATRIEYDETPEKSVKAFSLGKRGVDNLVLLSAGKRSHYKGGGKKNRSWQTVMSSAQSGWRFLCD